MPSRPTTALDVDDLVAPEVQALPTVAGLELKRQHAHADSPNPSG